MPRDPSPRGARRSPLPPAPLPAEVVRARLVEALAARFDVDLTVLVAGAGFGKTTALAQALRANEAAPRGIDAWVACEPSDEDATRLGAAVASALGRDAGPADPLERALDALRHTAPVDTCLVLDDLHELPTGSPGERFVVDLATHLPAHAHLVLASRTPVPVPLARRRAAGQVAEIDADALAFTDAEVTSLTRLVGGDEGACADLAGWPSLVRLVLSAPTGAMRQFLWEEIVTRLDERERAGLLALATLGSGSAAELSAVAGIPVDADALVTRVPLLHRDAQGRYGAHHLWDDAAVRIYAPAEVAAARRRALTVLVARRDTVRLGAAAVRWGDAGAYRQACVALVREGLGAFAIDTGERWLAGAPAGATDSPEHRLLDLAVRQARQRDLADIDGALDELETAFVRRGDRDGAMVTLALAAVVAHGRADALRILALAERIRALPRQGDDEPLLVFFLAAVDAAVASLHGDVSEVLRILDTVVYDAVPAPVTELVVRLHAVMLMLAGRADESEPLLQRLRSSPNSYVRAMPTMLHWAAGDPSRYLAARPDPTPPRDLNERDRLAFVTHVAAVATSVGDRALLDTVRSGLATPDGGRDPRDSAMVAAAAALAAVADHDEAAASAAIDAHLERHPWPGPLGETHLRRHLAVAYVLDARVRDRWKAADAGPVHRRAMALADALLDGRRGDAGTTGLLGDAGFVVCALPLPWSLELAVHAHAAGDDEATAFVRTLDGWLGEPVRTELARLAAAPALAPAAGALLARLPAGLGRPPLHVDVLGPLRLHCGDRELLGGELSRARVRTLLALLALLGPQRRERVADLLWPALAGDAAAQNLRVTLSRVRRLLRTVDDDADAWLPVRSDQVGLAGPPLVVTDLDRFRRHADTAARARRAGDSGAEQDELTAAVACWRGEPLVDLDGVDEARAAVEGVRRQLIDATLRLGELRLVGGDADGAVALAEQARAASPFLERAHRLAIAGLLRRNDAAALRAAVDTAVGALDELGVEPEDTTRMVLRNAEARLGGSRAHPL